MGYFKFGEITTIHGDPSSMGWSQKAFDIDHGWKGFIRFKVFRWVVTFPWNRRA